MILPSTQQSNKIKHIGTWPIGTMRHNSTAFKWCNTLQWQYLHAVRPLTQFPTPPKKTWGFVRLPAHHHLTQAHIATWHFSGGIGGSPCGADMVRARIERLQPQALKSQTALRRHFRWHEMQNPSVSRFGCHDLRWNSQFWKRPELAPSSGKDQNWQHKKNS